MASMRTLRRRLLRWQRYARRYRPGLWPRNYNVVRCDVHDTGGFQRAYRAVQVEQERRFWDETPEVWLGGPGGEEALLHYCPDCGHHGCEGDCDEATADGPDDDAGHGDGWQPLGEPPDDWRLP